MTTKEKKEYAALAAILFVFAVFIYWSFFRNPAPKVDPAQIQAAMAVAPAAAGATPGGAAPVGGGALPGATPVMGGATAAQTSIGSGQFLPHGTNLDFKILQDSRFQRLLEPVYPTVDRSEVGQDNPFANSLNSKNSSTSSATSAPANNAP